MHRLILFSIILLFSSAVFAQNVGIGIKNPEVKLDVSGGFRVSAEYITPVNPPGSLQTKTMVNATTTYLYTTDSAYRVFDPSGPSANYLANLNARLICNDTVAVTNECFEIVIENINLGTGDSLIICTASSPSAPILYKAGNNFTGSNIILSTSRAYFDCLFKSNSDASVGTGFSLLVKKKYLNTATPFAENSGTLGLLFHPTKAAFRSGKTAIGEIGSYSTGIGYEALASGNSAVAMGNQATASGGSAVAMGNHSIASESSSVAIGFAATASGIYGFSAGAQTEATAYATVALGYGTKALSNYAIAIGRLSEASGDNATAMGYNTTASGNYSTSMGRLSQASGNHSTAIGRTAFATGENAVSIGYSVSASGDYATALGTNVAAASDYSIAMGRSVSTASSPGSFIFGDNQTTLLTTTANNQMMMRFAGGYRLFSNAGATVGVSLAAGGNSWSTISDSTKKENYQPVNASSFLSKISLMRLGSWNYKGQDKKTFRHYGPMAQEFYNNFGNDDIGTIGNDTTIASSDIDGVIMIAIQALIKENEALKNKNEELEARLQKLESIINKTIK